jgi:hypothetical protein
MRYVVRHVISLDIKSEWVFHRKPEYIAGLEGVYVDSVDNALDILRVKWPVSAANEVSARGAAGQSLSTPDKCPVI